MADILAWIALIPLAGALLILFIPRHAIAPIRLVAVLATLLPLLLSVMVYLGFDRSAAGMQYVVHADWIHVPNALGEKTLYIGFDLGVDGVSLALLLLNTIVGFFAVLASLSQEERVKEYFLWFLVLETGLSGVFVSLDLFLLFLFLELTLVPMYFLLGLFGGERRAYVAFKLVLYRGVASAGILLSFVALAYIAAQGSASVTFNVSALAGALAHNAGTVPAAWRWIFLVLFVAILIEEAFVPFHTWLTDTHEEAPPAVSMVVGGVLVKTGAYLLVRVGVGLLSPEVTRHHLLIALFGVISILYGALLAVVQNDWRRLLAFTTISHMGVFLLGVASLTAEGLTGSVFVVVSSGLLTALMFFLVGAMAARTYTFSMDRLGGLSKSMPVLAGALLAGALGSLGLPGMSGFISEFLSFMGAFQAFPSLAALGALGIVLAAVYLLRAMQKTTFGPTALVLEGLRDIRSAEVLPTAVLLLLVILLGVYPALLGDPLHATLNAFMARIGG
jgi:NADH-quinone oxidoreductase subunit M